MNKNKKKFIEKLRKQSKDKLVSIIIELYEESFTYKKEIEKLQNLVFSHQQVVKCALENQNLKFLYQLSEEDDDEEAPTDRTKRDSVKSYV